MPKLFATMHVGQMNLDKRDRDRGERVAQCDAGMGQCASVDDQEPGAVGAGSLNAVHQRALVIALEKSDIRAAVAGNFPQFALDVVEAAIAVNWGSRVPSRFRLGPLMTSTGACMGLVRLAFWATLRAVAARWPHESGSGV